MTTPTPLRREYDFVGKRKLFAMVSAIACVLSLVLMIFPGPNYGIDFLGGSTIIVSFNEAVDPAEVREAVEEMGLVGPSVQRFGGAEDNQFLIETRSVTSITPERVEQLRTALVGAYGDETVLEADEESGDKIYVRLPLSAYQYAGSTEQDVLPTPAEYEQNIERFRTELAATLTATGIGDVSLDPWGNPADRRFAVRVQALQASVSAGMSAAFGERFASIDRVETVGPRVGQQLRDDGIQAVLLAMALVLLYIGIRFDIRYAPAAVIALAHDVLITLGVFVVLQEEINLPIIAAMLTIVGYSLNDTIVNFDRIRENIALAGDNKVDLWNLVNRSVNEMLSRTLLTALTTIIAVVVIFLLGGGLIHSFALAMFLGVTVGVYSSIYISNPIMVWMSLYMDERRKERLARQPAAVVGPSV